MFFLGRGFHNSSVLLYVLFCSFTSIMQESIRVSPSMVTKLRATFLKVSSICAPSLSSARLHRCQEIYVNTVFQSAKTKLFLPRFSRMLFEMQNDLHKFLSSVGIGVGPPFATYQPGQQCRPAERLTVLLRRVGGLCEEGMTTPLFYSITASF